MADPGVTSQAAAPERVAFERKAVFAASVALSPRVPFRRPDEIVKAFGGK
jgi:hypothetical protein